MSDTTLTEDGGPAFPLPRGTERVKRWQPGAGEYESTEAVSTQGISRRDYFAAAALQGLLSADAGFGAGKGGPRWAEPVHDVFQPGGGNWLNPKGVAGKAFEIADAMLRQSGKAIKPEDAT